MITIPAESFAIMLESILGQPMTVALYNGDLSEVEVPRKFISRGDWTISGNAATASLRFNHASQSTITVNGYMVIGGKGVLWYDSFSDPIELRTAGDSIDLVVTFSMGDIK